MERLDGKVAVITGGASGIGLAVAERLSTEGTALVLADIDESALAEAVGSFQYRGVPVLGVPTDVTDETSVAALADAARERFGSFHVVFNNAGVAGHFGLSWETALSDWRWVLDVNVWGVIHGLRAFVPTLVDQAEGHVVNTASLAGWTAAPGMAPYSASKHAVLAISESLRRELDAAQSGVGVSVLCPGMVNTRIMSSERNWPERLGEEPPMPSDPLSSAVRSVLVQGTTAGEVDAAAVAEAVLDGIVHNRFVVTSHPGELASAADRRVAVAGGETPSTALA